MLTAKEQKQIAGYEKRLAWPKWKFVLINGVLIWGCLMALLMSLADMVFFKKTFRVVLNRELWINLAGLGAGGLLYGLFLHWHTRHQYRLLKEKDSQSG